MKCIFVLADVTINSPTVKAHNVFGAWSLLPSPAFVPCTKPWLAVSGHRLGRSGWHVPGAGSKTVQILIAEKRHLAVSGWCKVAWSTGDRTEVCVVVVRRGVFWERTLSTFQ